MHTLSLPSFPPPPPHPGIGFAVVEEFLALGAQVVCVSRSRDELAQCAEAWNKKHGKSRTLAFAADLSTHAGREELVK